MQQLVVRMLYFHIVKDDGYFVSRYFWTIILAADKYSGGILIKPFAEIESSWSPIETEGVLNLMECITQN